MNKFYIFLGSKFGNIFANKKKFKSDVETFFAEESIQVKQVDIRQTHSNRYHAFVTLYFVSKEKLAEYISLIRAAPTSIKYLVINNTWKIYEYIPKNNRKFELNAAFCEEDDDDDAEVVVGDNVLEESEEEQNDKEVSFIEYEDTEYEDTKYEDTKYEDTEYEEPSYEHVYEYNEYESIYTWLVTPQLHELKKAEEMKELCRWLSTSFWERT
jgi:hypothetical protein